MRATRVIATPPSQTYGNDGCSQPLVFWGTQNMRIDDLAALFHHEPVGATFTFLLLTLAVLAAIVAAVMAAHSLKDNVHEKVQSRAQSARARRRVHPL
jgi:hypothetical protein